MMYHKPALLQESMKGLKIKPNGTYLDMTFGGGGFSSEILRNLKNGKLIAFDRDEDAKQNNINDKRFALIISNYKFFYHFLVFMNIRKVDGIIADLGVSSHHFDAPERGFAHRLEGPLDMRMNKKSRKNAEWYLNNLEEKELQHIFSRYGEIKNAKKMSAAIVAFRQIHELKTISQLKKAIQTCMPKKSENQYLSKVFQALRIQVNNELEALKKMLLQTEKVLVSGGRLVIISYHSLEDRIVKNYIKKGVFEGEAEKDFYGNIQTPYKPINKGVITPSQEELTNNTRVRSAKLRIAEKK